MEFKKDVLKRMRERIEDSDQERKAVCDSQGGEHGEERQVERTPNILDHTFHDHPFVLKFIASS